MAFEGQNLDFQVAFSKVVPDPFTATITLTNGTATVGVDTGTPLCRSTRGRPSRRR